MNPRIRFIPGVWPCFVPLWECYDGITLAYGSTVKDTYLNFNNTKGE